MSAFYIDTIRRFILTYTNVSVHMDVDGAHNGKHLCSVYMWMYMFVRSRYQVDHMYRSCSWIHPINCCSVGKLVYQSSLTKASSSMEQPTLSVVTMVTAVRVNLCLHIKSSNRKDQLHQVRRSSD